MQPTHYVYIPIMYIQFRCCPLGNPELSHLVKLFEMTDSQENTGNFVVSALPCRRPLHRLVPWFDNALQWRHNEHDGVSNHQPHDCLLNRLFKAQIKENIKFPRHWPLCGLCAGHSPVTGEFPAQRTSNAENISIWWRHHGSLTWHGSNFQHSNSTMNINTLQEMGLFIYLYV